METAIQIVWWIGLLGALVATAVILKEVFSLLGLLRNILQLAEYTHTAARGLVRNAQAAKQMEGLAQPADELRQAARALSVATAAAARQVGVPPAKLGGKGG